MIAKFLDFNILLFDMISIYLRINPIPLNLKSSVYTLYRYPSNINLEKAYFMFDPE